MQGTRLTTALSIALLLTLGSTDADARIYTWVDEHGDTHYGDKVPNRYKKDSKNVKLRNETTSFPDAGNASSAGGLSGNRSYRNNKPISTGPTSKRKQKSRHSKGPRHDRGPGHASKSRHKSGPGHATGTRHSTKSRHAY